MAIQDVDHWFARIKNRLKLAQVKGGLLEGYEEMSWHPFAGSVAGPQGSSPSLTLSP